MDRLRLCNFRSFKKRSRSRPHRDLVAAAKAKESGGRLFSFNFRYVFPDRLLNWFR